MGRRAKNVFLTVLLTLATQGLLPAEPAAARDGQDQQDPVNQESADVAGPGGNRAEVRQRWKDLPAPMKRRFRQNLERWEKMPEARKREILQRHRRMRRAVEMQVEEFLQEQDVQLTEQRRQEFERRYLQERQALEQELLEKLRRERQERLPRIFAGLKEEFPEFENTDTADPARD